MRNRFLSYLGFCLGLISVGGDSPSTAVPDGLLATQVSLNIDEGNSQIRFRATVIDNRPGEVTILTAAHCLAPRDTNRRITISQDKTSCRARVVKVVQNPHYRREQAGDAPGADGALVWLELPKDGPQAEAIRQIPTARLTESLVGQSRQGQTMTVRAFDQKGGEHIVRAGNYSNPRWLEWGDVYRPRPGDSGGGVFIVRKKPDGGLDPILIGVVVERSLLGGGGSLVGGSESWVQQATRP